MIVLAENQESKRVAEDKSLQLDLETLPTKYIALCEFTAALMGDGATAKDIDKQVEMFLKLTNFEVSEEGLPEV